jgi:hypothetical protein
METGFEPPREGPQNIHFRAVAASRRLSADVNDVARVSTASRFSVGSGGWFRASRSPHAHLVPPAVRFTTVASVCSVPVVFSLILALLAVALARDRRPSFPNISGDGYRSFADVVCDESGCPVVDAIRQAVDRGLSAFGLTVRAVPVGWHDTIALTLPVPWADAVLAWTKAATSVSVLRDGTVVFVKIDMLQGYLSAVAPLQCGPNKSSTGHGHGPRGFRHIVLCHEGDLAFTEQHRRLLDASSCVSALYVQNIAHGVAPHQRLRSIPIGFEDRWRSHGSVASAFGSMTPALTLLQHVRSLEHLMSRAGLIDSTGRFTGPRNVTSTAAKPFEARPFALAAFHAANNLAARCSALRATVQLDGVATSRVSGADRCESQPLHSVPHWAGVFQRDLVEAWIMWGADWPEGPWRENRWDSADIMGGATQQRKLSKSSPLSQPWVSAGMDQDPKLPDLAPHLAEYLRLLSNHPFVLSPEGNGIQCHRTWEALLSGAIPVLTATHTAVDDVLDGLPAVLIPDWEAIAPAHLWLNSLKNVGAPPSVPTAATAAVRLLLGVHMRVRVALLNTFSARAMQAVIDSQTQTEDHSTGGTGILFQLWQHPRSDSAPLCVLDIAAAEVKTLDDCRLPGGERIIETFPFDPAIAAVPTAQLSSTQLYRLAHSVLDLDRMYLPYWLQQIQRARVL